VLIPIENIIVTAALPYANDRLHLGHLRSTYIPADTYVRYLRLKGRNVIYVCATDEHGTPITLRSEEEAVPPKEIADRYNEAIGEDLKNIGCSLDKFGRTTSPTHYELTQEFFKQLRKKGYIYKTSYEQLYCPKCNRFLPDRYVQGACPHCGGEKARGDACEVCGRYLKPSELKNPYCVFCGTTPEIRETEHWFFKLSAFQAFLEEWIGENEELPLNVKNYAYQWLKDGLKDWCITRDLDWGVPVPVEGAEGKVIYVWFDAPIGYISSTVDWAKSRGDDEKWKAFWQEGCGRIVHFIGKDIVYHHSIFWPAMLKAHGEYNLPHKIVAGEYLTLEGRKMSKSRGWVVNVEEYLKEFDPDPLRYFLIVASPLSKDADFSWDEFARRNNDELADILGNFIHRSLTFTCRFFDERIPRPSKIGVGARETLNAVEKTRVKAGRLIESFNFHRAIREIIELAAEGNRYLNAEEPWRTVENEPQEAATTLYVVDQIVKALSILLEPFLPFTAEKIWKFLNLPGNIHRQRWEDVEKPLPPGHKINIPTPLFKKIRLEEIPPGKKLKK
jgi:methionyl-tRNA synthetase